ncbi:hypothetical protein LPJ66_011132, partial [Kickxella alabastrina]
RHHQNQNQQHNPTSHQSSQQSLRTALAGGDSLDVYGRTIPSPLMTSQNPSPNLGGIPGSPFYSAGAGSNLSGSNLGSNDMSDMYSR